MSWKTFAGTPFKYEYQCINKNGETVAEGEFILRQNCTIRSPQIIEKGIFAVFENDRDKLLIYSGYNCLKKIKMKITNLNTNSVRYFE